MDATYWLTRKLFKQSLASIYFIGFLILVNQSKALIGSSGITPASLYVGEFNFFQSPSLFFLYLSDGFLAFASYFGLFLSIAAMSGLTEKYGNILSTLVWFLLWALYLSFVNIGQIFYGFGWEILLLEAGFLTIFLGANNTKPPVIVIWLIRWAAFRIMLGAGLIKIRGDECWRDFTCMYYYYETQPMPNPLSWYFHHLPLWIHRLAVGVTHFVELLVPFGLLLPDRFKKIRYAAALITIGFQLMLIMSGNLSWLNYMTIILCFSCFDDELLSRLMRIKVPKKLTEPKFLLYAVRTLAAMVAVLSISPVINLLSSRQMMNTSFEPFHLVNTYGAFGSITKKRMEIVVEGTRENEINEKTQWQAYEFKGKPGDPFRMPRQVSPYHYKLDWQMWFAAMSSYQDHPWFLALVARLLQNNPDVLDLLAYNPFKEEPPRYLRALLYEYHFTEPGDPSKAWWTRELRGIYLEPVHIR